MEQSVLELVRRAELVGGYEILAACTPAVSRRSDTLGTSDSRLELVLDVDLQSQRFARRQHPSAHTEASIESRWQEQAAVLGDRLWNASKFRLAGIHHICQHTSTVSIRTVYMQVGLTDYRAHQGTTLSPNALERFHSIEEDAPWCHLANAIGNAGVLETHDGKIVCQRRSDKLGEASGLWVLPGGHPEPMNLDHHLDLSSAVRKEFFDAVIHEICDELNLDADTVSDPVLLGVVRRKADWRPTYACWARTSLTADEVQDRWRQGGKDTAESTALQFLHSPTDDELLPNKDACSSMLLEACGLSNAEVRSDRHPRSISLRMVEDHRGALCLYWIQRIFRAGLLPSSHQSCEFLLRSAP
ncbi:nudix (nucleoside diphosphate linked moiety X)-type motif 22 [Cyanidiococcus yangmingshanensis]|uniref:Nudix (Nucleoside diphosphate linked moiety X)-type motif 22 n=1 Tax=Cyanidiococcus yangmingshanensis TaxID=2690220 RepID=A0A7J7IP67_9RHOD|nr:nudix (nucleoside diphosphate linked moiety X)-type motif 22 [Cyanidiococcus yangmingshanensis]